MVTRAEEEVINWEIGVDIYIQYTYIHIHTYIYICIYILTVEQLLAQSEDSGAGHSSPASVFTRAP